MGRALGWQVSGNSCNRAPHALSLFTSNKICFDCFYTPLTLFITFHFSHFHFLQGVPGVPGCQLIEIKTRSRGLIQIISNLSKWESLKQKPLPLATCYCCHDLLQFEIIWKVPTPLILISIRNFFLGHSVLLHKGSHPLRKVQFFWTLFKKPLPPPPFRLNIMWWIFLKEF